MDENLLLTLKAIKRSAEMILEHQANRGYSNDITNVAAKNIRDMSKSLIESLERKKL